MVALDAGTGKKIWQTFTILETAKPTRKIRRARSKRAFRRRRVVEPDHRRTVGVLYVATGDNYSDPPTNTSDAILAMDLKSGKLLWSKQLTENDAFNTACSSPQPGRIVRRRNGPDYDFGQPPILVNLDPDNQGQANARW